MSKTLKRMLKTSITMIFALVTANFVAGQSGDVKASEILETMQERYEASIKGIDDFITVKEDQTTYHIKAWDNGRPYFKVRTEAERMDRAQTSSNVTERDLFSDTFQKAKERATYEGTDELNGNRVHVLYIDKLDDVIVAPESDGSLEDVWLYIDPEIWVLRQMRYNVEFTTDDGVTREVAPVIEFRDFRDVEGMMIAYETATIVRGLALTDEERLEAEQMIKEAEKQFEAMPEAQQHLVEQMMGDKIAKFRNMLEEDQYEAVTRVKEVKVNTGLEDFD